MSQHTPGPWKIVRISGGHVKYVSGVDDYPICYGDMDYANADLIAAAPDMFEALGLLTDWAEGVVRYGTVKGAALMPLENAKAALKKARGESC